MVVCERAQMPQASHRQMDSDGQRSSMRIPRPKGKSDYSGNAHDATDERKGCSVKCKLMTTELRELADRWRRESNQYQKQVAECQSKGLPCEQMLSMMLCLRSCARCLDTVQLIPNTQPQEDQPRQ